MSFASGLKQIVRRIGYHSPSVISGRCTAYDRVLKDANLKAPGHLATRSSSSFSALQTSASTGDVDPAHRGRRLAAILATATFGGLALGCATWAWPVIADTPKQDDAKDADDAEFPLVWFGYQLGFDKEYTIGNVVGEGSYGLVHRCTHKHTQEEFAVKVLDKKAIRSSEAIEDIEREVELMMLVRGHENIAYLKEAFENEDTVFLVMELLTGGNIYDRYSRTGEDLTENDVAHIVTQVLNALAHCHLKGVVMCDVKPDNFLFEQHGPDAKLKAIDFGLSRQFTPGRALRRAAGTAFFVAPEVLRYEYGPESDVWSVGVMAYLLLIGRVPFNGQSEKEVLLNVMRGTGPDYEASEWRLISPEAQSFVRALLNRDAALRPSACAALSHPWLRNSHTVRGSCFDTPLDSAVVCALDSFARSGRMRKIAVRAMARETAASKLKIVNDLEEQFKRMDADHTEKISLEELKHVIEQSSLKYTDTELRQLLKGLDMDGAGTINYLEFVAAGFNLHQLMQEDFPEFERLARTAFGKFDVEAKGFFTAVELKKALRTTRKCYSQGGDITDAQAAELIAQADTTGDGKVFFRDFLELLRKDTPASRYGWVKTPDSQS